MKNFDALEEITKQRIAQLARKILVEYESNDEVDMFLFQEAASELAIEVLNLLNDETE